MTGRIPRRGSRPFRVCTCGLVLTYPEWATLPLVGHIADDDLERVEHRNCPRCRTTFTRRSQIVRVVYKLAPLGDGFVIWRQAGACEDIAIGRSAYARTFETEVAALGRVKLERERDRSAACRLGVVVLDDR